MPTTRIKTYAKTGKTRKKIGRPRTSMIDKLSNLHLLLRAPYFSKWPLELRFFSQSVHKTWLAYNERVDDQIRPDIPILLDQVQPVESEDEPSSAQKPSKRRMVDLIGKGGVEGVDPTYAKFQPVLQKLQHRIDDKSDVLTCELCDIGLDIDKDLFNICLDQDCTCMTHLSCLSTQFLKNASLGAFVPKDGRCPACNTTLQWADLMRLLSLRLRGQKEIGRLLKKRNRGAAAVAAELLEDDSTSEDGDVVEDVMKVGINHESDNELDDVASVASTCSTLDTGGGTELLPARRRDKVEIVIDDSEDER